MSNEQVALERVLRGKCVTDAAADAAIAGVIAAGFHLTPAPQVVTTVDELEALPIATVVRSAGGTIGSRLSATEGVCFGIEASFPWRNLSLPATVLYPHTCPDDEPEHGNPFGDVEDYLGPLTIRPGVQRARVWDDGDPEAAREFWQDGRWS